MAPARLNKAVTRFATPTPGIGQAKTDKHYYEHLYSRSANSYNFDGELRNAVRRRKNGRLAA